MPSLLDRVAARVDGLRGGAARPVDVDAASVVFDPVVHGLGVFGGQYVRLTDGPGGQARFASFEAVYESNPWLWAVVNTIARAQARLPLKLYKEIGDELRERIRPNPGPGGASAATRLALALHQPAPPDTAARDRTARGRKALWFGTKVDRLVHGNGLWRIHRNRDGVTGFERIPAVYVRLDERAMTYRVRRPWETSDELLIPEDVVHFGLWAGGRAWSQSPIAALRRTIALYDAVERHLTSFFEKGARPSGHLKVDKATGGPARTLIRDEITNLYASADNAGRVLVTSGEWTSITESPDNSKVVELAKQSREEICTAFGVSPPLVGILDRAIMSNVRELRDHHVRDLIGPHAEFDEDDIQSQVIDVDPRLRGVFCEFDLDAQLRPDVEARSKTFRDKRFVYSLNELRKEERLPRIDHPDADVPWIPLNEAPINERPDDRDEPAEPPPPPPPDDDGDDSDDEARLVVAGHRSNGHTGSHHA